MTGYSETPLLKKLGIKDGSRIAFVNAPKDFPAELGPLPEGTNIVHASLGALDLILIFTRSKAALIRKLAWARPYLSQNGMSGFHGPRRVRA
jgi:hypothetical protein